MDELAKAGKIRAIGLSHIRPTGSTEAMQTAGSNGLIGRAFSRPGTIWSSARSSKGQLRDAALAHGLGIIPFYGLANGFLTGKYRSKEDLDKSARGLRNVEYLEGRGMRVLEALDRVAAETGAALATVALAWTNGRSRGDHSPADSSPARRAVRVSLTADRCTGRGMLHSASCRAARQLRRAVS